MYLYVQRHIHIERYAFKFLNTVTHFQYWVNFNWWIRSKYNCCYIRSIKCKREQLKWFVQISLCFLFDYGSLIFREISVQLTIQYWHTIELIQIKTQFSHSQKLEARQKKQNCSVLYVIECINKRSLCPNLKIGLLVGGSLIITVYAYTQWLHRPTKDLLTENYLNFTLIRLFIQVAAYISAINKHLHLCAWLTYYSDCLCFSNCLLKRDQNLHRICLNCTLN